MGTPKHVCIYGQECWCGAGPDTRSASDGRRVYVAGVTGNAGWPRESDAFGVCPGQQQEAQQESLAIGVPTAYTESGQAIITSEAHQRRLGRALGMHENNCFNW